MTYREPPPHVARLAELIAGGMLMKEACAEVGVDPTYVSYLRRRWPDLNIPKGSARAKPAGPREQRMADLYRLGYTLVEIGAQFGITRERVRQLIKKHFGMNGANGGAAVKGKRKQADRRHVTARRVMRIWGMPLDEYEAHVAVYGSSSDLTTPMGRFRAQKNSARRRGVSWDMTFAEWWQVWQESGKWEERGRTSSAYVMARFKDDRGYSIGNVYICTSRQNIQDSYITNPNDERRKKRRKGICREAALLSAQGVHYTEIANRLGLCKTTVYTYIVHGRKSLAKA